MTHFEEKLVSVKTPDDMAALINALLEDSLSEDEPSYLAEYLEAAAKHGVCPAPKLSDGKFYAHILPWGGTKSHLEAARVMFSNFGVPQTEDESFLDVLWERAKADRSDYLLSLYLMAASRSREENHIMSLSRRMYDYAAFEEFSFERQAHKCECCGTKRETVYIIHRETEVRTAQIEW